jgi:hypothetical protein
LAGEDAVPLGRPLLGTTALLGAGLAGAVPAAAAGVQGGGPLELTISGHVGVLAHGGNLDNQREDPDLSTGLDFSTDVELHLLARGEDERTGIEHGATIELEADTNETANADETWIFLRGGWGEVRLGDEDGPVGASAIGAYTIAAGTGGIDGDVVDALAVDAVLPAISDDATKVRYYTPDFGGFSVGVSYTPDADQGGDSLALKDTELQDWVEGAAVFEGEIQDAGILASLVGGVGEVNDADSGRGRLWTWYAGVAASLPWLELGAGYGREDLAGQERHYLNAGLGRELGAAYASITHGRVLGTKGYEGVGEPWNLVLSADVELMPGVVLAGDVAWFDNDLDAEAREATGGDQGLVWVTRLELAF